MRQWMISSTTQQLLAAVMPIAALALTLLVIYPGWGRYRALQAQVEQRRIDLAELRATPLPPRDQIVSAVPAGPAEPSQFLGEMAALATASQCQIVALETMTGPAPGEPARTRPNDVVRPVRASVTVAGYYPRIRYFILQLERAPRRYTVVEVSVRTSVTTYGPSRDLPTGLLTAIVTIERYLVSPTTALADAAGAAR